MGQSRALRPFSLSAEAMVHVEVSNIAGAVLKLEVSPNTTVQDMKGMISPHWQVPGLCQSFVLDSALLRDSDVVMQLSKDGTAAPPITMLVSLEGISDNLKHPNKVVRCEALNALLKIAFQGNEPAVAQLAAHCQRQGTEVTPAIMRTLVKVVEQGDQRAISALMALLRHGNVFIRGTALQALGKLADKDDEHVLAALRAHAAKDRSKEVRTAAEEVLAHFSAPAPTISL